MVVVVKVSVRYTTVIVATWLKFQTGRFDFEVDEHTNYGFSMKIPPLLVAP